MIRRDNKKADKLSKALSEDHILGMWLEPLNKYIYIYIYRQQHINTLCWRKGQLDSTDQKLHTNWLITYRCRTDTKNQDNISPLCHPWGSTVKENRWLTPSEMCHSWERKLYPKRSTLGNLQFAYRDECTGEDGYALWLLLDNDYRRFQRNGTSLSLVSNSNDHHVPQNEYHSIT